MTDTAVGVVFTPKSPPERLREVARAAEAAGFAQLWLWEDCFYEGGLTSATAALAWTERGRPHRRRPR
jgi:alkanesulfonate monooxygenase SsuD/methylene tetrahydromethanopterin reductase-like flavin-dependent oxidoreductase (luciferase family)